MTLRLRHVARVNPPTPAFDAAAASCAVTFLPLEAVWPDGKADLSRQRPKAEVATGYVRFEESDVLLPKTAPTFQHGRTVVARGLVNGIGAGSSELHVLRVNADHDPRFLAYIVRSQRFIDGGIAAYEGVAGLQRVPPEFVLDWPIADLPVEQERRLADFLDAQIALLNSALMLRQRQRELLDARLDAEMAAMIAGTAVDGDELLTHPVLGPVNGTWPVRRLKHVTRRVGVGVVVNPSSYFAEEGVPFLHGGNVRAGSFDLRGVKRISDEDSRLLSRSRLEAGDVLVVRAGYPGRAAVVTPELAGSNCASVLIVRPGDDILPKWIETFFNSRQGRAQVSLVQYGAAQEQINLGDVVDFILPTPPLRQQRALMVELMTKQEQMMSLAASIDRQAMLLRERRAALIAVAVTGGLDPATARDVA